MKLKYLIFLILFGLQFNLLAQKVKLSPNNNYFAVYFQNIKDSVVFVEERGEFNEKLVFFAKYKICLFDAKTAKELYNYETKLFQLANNKPNVKLEFDGNSEFLYVAIENKEALVFNTKKGFTSKYKAQDFCFNSDFSKIALLEPNKISILNSGKQVKRKFESFTDVSYSNDNKFIIASRKARNKNVSVFTELENPKNNKIVKWQSYVYHSENEEIKVFNSSKIITYKTSNLKEKETNLAKRFLSSQYKKNYHLVSFNKNGEFLVLLSEKYISVISAKGKGVADFEKSTNFVNYSWIDNSNIKIISANKIQYYNIDTKTLTDEGNLEFTYPKNVSVYSKKQENEHKFYSISDKFAALNLKKGFLLKNTLTNQQAYIENETFLNFSENEKYVFTKINKSEIRTYKLSEIFTKKHVLLLKTSKIQMLSAFGGAYYLSQNPNSFYSQNLKTIATTYSDVEIDTTYHESGKSLLWFYNEFTQNNNKKLGRGVTSEISYINTITLFDTGKQNSKNLMIDRYQDKHLSPTARLAFFINPIIQSNYRDSLKSVLYKNTLSKRINDIKITNAETFISRDNSSNIYKVIDIKEDRFLTELEKGSTYFSPNNSFIIVVTALKTILYNALSGEEIRSYDKIYTNILITNDHSFFIGLNKAGTYEFVGINKQENLNSAIVKITKNGKYLLVVEKSKTNFTLYSLPDFKEITNKNIDAEYKKYFYNPQIELSTNGAYFSCQYKNQLAIFSTQTSSDNEKTIKLEDLTNENAAYWINDEEFIVSRAESSEVFNAKTDVFTSNKDFNFYFDDAKINSLKQEKYSGFISNNSKFSVLQFSEKGQDYLYLKNTSEKHKKYLIQNAKFIAFSENDDRIYFQRGSSKIAFIETREISNLTDIELKIHSIKAIRERTRVLPPRPSVIIDDFTPPEGYHFERFIKPESIENTENKELGIYAHNLISDGNNVSLNLHLLDKNGNFYSGSDTSNSKDIWCELWIKYPDGSIKKIEHFDVSEKKQGDIPSFSLSLVLDHSGSMGKNRCLSLQRGSRAFIDKKRKNDAVSVLKFDENINTEVLLSASKEFLLNKLQIDGGKDFGGNTALYDAIYEGITEVSKTSAKSQKAVIIMTDGYDNASFTYLNELIIYALENNVKIYTIGFGKFINKAVLQSIAYQTGGSYYEIYNTSDFLWIYEDVFNKLSNYYRLNFSTPLIGKYTIMLKPCSDKVENNIILAFDNSEIDYSKLREYGNSGFGVPFIDLSDSLDISVFNSKKPIPNINKIVSTNGSNYNYFIPKEFEEIKFPDIKFITDKTVIIKGTDKGLDEVIEFLKKHPHIIIEISGHTDEVGTDENNMGLSDRRSAKVKSIIVKAGVNTNRIYTVGYGETKPIATNETSEGKLKNRRVEFRIMY